MDTNPNEEVLVLDSNMVLKGITIAPKTRTSKGYNGSQDPRYQTAQWKRDRKLHLQMNPLCRLCQEQGITRAATVSDHIKPISQGGSMWDWNNRQPLCKECNAKKTALDNPNNQ